MNNFYGYLPLSISSANLNFSWAKNWTSWSSSSFQYNQNFNYSKLRQSDIDFLKKSNKLKYYLVEDCAFGNGVFYFSPNSYIIIVEVVPKQPKTINPNAGGGNMQVLNQILQQLTQINTNVMNLQVQVNNLQTQVNNLEKRVTFLEDEVKSIRVEFTEKFNILDKKIDKVDAKVDKANKKIAILDKKMDKVYDAVIELQEIAEADGKVITKKLKK